MSQEVANSAGAAASRSDLHEVLQYHGDSKHRPNKSAPAPCKIDWSDQPDPFRRYHGAPLTLLPILSVEDDKGTVPYDALFQPRSPPA